MITGIKCCKGALLLKDTPVATRTVPNISWKRNCGTSRRKSFLSNDKPTTICMSNAPKVCEKHSNAKDDK